MSDLGTPLLDSLFREIEQARNTAAVLTDYRNENTAFRDQIFQLKEQLVHLKDQSGNVAAANGTLSEQVASLKAQLFEAQARFNTAESQARIRIDSLEDRLRISQAGQANLQEMNTGLAQVTSNLEAEIQELKNKYEPKSED